MTEEHPLTEALRRGQSILVEVKVPDAAGRLETTFTSPPIKMKDASAKILCQVHNGALSRADQEAVRLQEALQEIHRRDRSPLISLAERVVIDGYLWAQFLCKYTVGSFVIHDPRSPPAADLVRYAFGLRPSRPVHFYFAQKVGDKPGFGRTDNAPIVRIESPADPSLAYVVEVAGVRTIITHLTAGDPLLTAVMNHVAPATPWLNRLKGIDSPVKGETYQIVFDWDRDPFESHLLDARGIPVSAGPS